MVPEVTIPIMTAVGTGTIGTNGKNRSAESAEPKSGVSVNGENKPDMNTSGDNASDGTAATGITHPLPRSISVTAVSRIGGAPSLLRRRPPLFAL